MVGLFALMGGVGLLAVLVIVHTRTFSPKAELLCDVWESVEQEK